MANNSKRRYEISDDDYERIEPLLSGKPGDLGRNADDNRRFINAVLWIARTGAPWQDLPERYGKHNTAYQRFNRWAKKGRWQAIFQALQDPDLEWIMLVTSVVRAHQHAAGQKKRCRDRGPRTLMRRFLKQGPRCCRCPRQPPRVYLDAGSGGRLPAGRGALAPL